MDRRIEIHEAGYSTDKMVGEVINERDRMNLQASALKDVMIDLFGKKIILYQDLIKCLEDEKGVLVKADVERLWEIADQKTTIVGRIDVIRSKMLEALTAAGIDHGIEQSKFELAKVYESIPESWRCGLTKAYFALVKYRMEVHVRCEENKQYVQECLEFLDDLVQLLATAGNNSLYNNGQKMGIKGDKNLLFHREV